MSAQQAQRPNDPGGSFIFIFNSIFEPQPVRISLLYRFYWECCHSCLDRPLFRVVSLFSFSIFDMQNLILRQHPRRRILLSRPICGCCWHQICPACHKFVVRDDGDFEDQPGTIAEFIMSRNDSRVRSGSQGATVHSQR
jgi:hypothetical protein